VEIEPTRMCELHVGSPDLKNIHVPTFSSDRHPDQDMASIDRCPVSASDCRGLRCGWTCCWGTAPVRQYHLLTETRR
jgi:hypothetical protein